MVIHLQENISTHIQHCETRIRSESLSPGEAAGKTQDETYASNYDCEKNSVKGLAISWCRYRFKNVAAFQKAYDQFPSVAHRAGAQHGAVSVHVLSLAR